MALDQTTFAPALKRLYPHGPKEILYKKCPTLAVLKKTTDFVGEAKASVPIFAGTMGSHTASTAFGTKKDTQMVRFLVTRKKDYAAADLDGETILASKNDKGAIARSLKVQVDGAMYTINRSIALGVFGNGGGARGKGDGAWTITGASFTLLEPKDVVNFEVGYVLEFASTDGTSGSKRVGTVTVTAVDRATGVITTSSADISADVASVANTDYIFRQGDFGAAPTGFRGWCPDSTPSATAFFGVDRTVDPVRLGGQRYTAASTLLEEDLIDFCSQATTNGADFDYCSMNPMRVAQLSKNAYSKVWLQTDVKTVGMNVLKVQAGPSTLHIIPDPNCPYARSYLFERDAIEVACLDEIPHFITDDSLKFLRSSSADTIEFRLRALWNMIVHEPNKLGVLIH
jgi:hypothetical protein